MSDSDKKPTMDQKIIPQHVLDEAAKQYEILTYGAIEVIPEDDFKKMLIDSLLNNRPFIVTGKQIGRAHV